jgi:hypothetical protein
MSGLPKQWRDLPRCPFFGRKVCHPTRESAVAHADHLNGLQTSQGGGPKVTVRRCHVCDTYHVGNRRKRRKH